VMARTATRATTEIEGIVRRHAIDPSAANDLVTPRRRAIRPRPRGLGSRFSS
jgi:hypothetical protein